LGISAERAADEILRALLAPQASPALWQGVGWIGLGVVRWVVERTLSWLHQFRRLRMRDERRDDIHEAFLQLGCALICWNALEGSLC